MSESKSTVSKRREEALSEKLHALFYCECGHSIDRHHAGTQRGECRTYNCFCTLKPSDVFAARVAAEGKIAAVVAEEIEAAARAALVSLLAWTTDQGAYDFTRSAVACELSNRIAALGGEATS